MLQIPQINYMISNRGPVVYVNPTSDKTTDRLVEKYYPLICKICKDQFYNFIYLPQFLNQIQLQDLLDYYCPELTPDEREAICTESQDVTSVYRNFSNMMGKGVPQTTPFFLFYGDRNSSEFGWEYTVQPITSTTDDAFLNEVTQRIHFRHISRSVIAEKEEIYYEEIASIEDSRKSSSDDSPSYDRDYLIEKMSLILSSKDPILKADRNFIYSTIADEIRLRINLLRQNGVSEFIIRQLLNMPPSLPSRMCITHDHHIILTDYNNREIKMSALAKAVYFLFLRHPEGLMFKELSDHKKELFELYKNISNRTDMVKMEESINDIINSTKNSINEKCSRIKEAFLSEFDDEIAQNYYIQGKALSPKHITLDRTLITDESNLVL